MKKLKIAQVGSFDVENFGDLLFPVILKNKLSLEQLDLFSPNGGRQPFTENEYVFPLCELEQKCLSEKYDAIIIGGGDLIRSDKTVVRSYETEFITSLSLWQLPILIGHKLNIPVVFNSPGVPLEFSSKERKFVKELLSMVEYISVRDEFSKEKLEQCGVKNVEVIPDTVLSISKILPINKCNKIYNDLIKKNRIVSKDRYIIFQHNIESINNESYIKKVKHFLSEITNKFNYNVYLFPIGYVHKDIDFLTKVYDDSNEKITLITEKFSPEEMLSIFAHSSGYIGTSMHGLVAAYAYSKPILAINLRKLSKIKGMLKNIGCSDFEVKNTSELIDIFQHNFLKYKENPKKRNSILLKIDKHFDKIYNIIENYSSLKDNHKLNTESNLLNSIYSGFFDNTLPKIEKISVFLDYGYGYSEDDKVVVSGEYSSKNINFTFPISPDIKGIRIDLIEENFIIINSLSIKVNGKKVNYYIPCSFEIDKSTLLINNLDPQIYIENNLKEGVLEFNANVDIINYSDNYDIYDKLNQKKLEVELVLEESNKTVTNLEKELKEKDEKMDCLNKIVEEQDRKLEILNEQIQQLNNEIEYLNSKLINRIVNFFTKRGKR